MSDAAVPLASVVRERATVTGRPLVVGIAGGVAAGKSTLAGALRDALSEAGVDADIVGTDGFLHPNDMLAARGLLGVKGFPATYDAERLADFVRTVRSGAPDVTVPVYSHETYDIVPGARARIRPRDVVVVEGLNALYALVGLLDLAVYVHAEEELLESWYLTRFRHLRAAAADDPGSFYRMFVSMSDEQADAVARQVWREVNIVNLREHIAPSRAHAHRVVVKGADHEVLAIEVCEHGRPIREG